MCFYTLLLAQLFILQTDNSARERLGKKILAAREIGENVSTTIERGGRGDFESEGERERDLQSDKNGKKCCVPCSAFFVPFTRTAEYCMTLCFLAVCGFIITCLVSDREVRKGL